MKTFKTYLYEKENEDSHPTIYTHYSHASDLNHLSGNMSGTGIKGAEQERLKGTTDSRIKSRVYFYPSCT